MILFDAIGLLIKKPAWSMKIGRDSDPDVAMIMDFTGSFLTGPTESHNKNDYSKPFQLAVHLIRADNWTVFTNCEWDE
jgi:hypothetical protein